MKKFYMGAVATTVLATVALTSCGKTEVTPAEEKPPVENNDSTEKQEPTSGNTVTGSELVSNVHARKAMAMGYNKDYIIDSILNNGSLKADYFVPSGFVVGPDNQDFRDDGKLYLEYDVAAAQAEWALAKEELGFDTVEVEFMNYDSDGSKKIAEFIKSELEQNLEGLIVKISPLPFQQKLEAGRNGEFEINFAGWGPDYLDARTYLDMFLTGNLFHFSYSQLQTY